MERKLLVFGCGNFVSVDMEEFIFLRWIPVEILRHYLLHEVLFLFLLNPCGRAGKIARGASRTCKAPSSAPAQRVPWASPTIALEILEYYTHIARLNISGPRSPSRLLGLSPPPSWKYLLAHFVGFCLCKSHPGTGVMAPWAPQLFMVPHAPAGVIQHSWETLLKTARCGLQMKPDPTKLKQRMD